MHSAGSAAYERTLWSSSIPHAVEGRHLCFALCACEIRVQRFATQSAHSNRVGCPPVLHSDLHMGRVDILSPVLRTDVAESSGPTKSLFVCRSRKAGFSNDRFSTPKQDILVANVASRRFDSPRIRNSAPRIEGVRVWRLGNLDAYRLTIPNTSCIWLDLMCRGIRPYAPTLARSALKEGFQ